jgi:hypothetical protein
MNGFEKGVSGISNVRKKKELLGIYDQPSVRLMYPCVASDRPALPRTDPLIF